jgi:hypothetical protein
MRKRRSTPKLDVVENARRVVETSIRESEVSLAVISNPSILSRVMAEMGRRGGRIGGKRRLETLTDERRREIASQAAKARWSKQKKSKKS